MYLPRQTDMLNCNYAYTKSFLNTVPLSKYMSELPFAQYSPSENEEKIVSFWEEKRTTQKIAERNKNGKKFYFLQGPPYTSGNLHAGQGWNHALKDAILRYKRMNGHKVLARAGYDMHGLPTELKVQKKLNLNGKDDIAAYGHDSFVTECLAWSEEKAAQMNKDLQRMGVTLDFTDPYKPITQDYIDSIWFLIKEADKKNRLYLGEKTMMWCPATESALAKHEVEYKEVVDTSVFLKFKKEGTDNEYFVIWTTTPWTIPFNLAIMVNPDMEYVDATVTTATGKETWTICKDLANVFLGNVDDISFEISEPYLGKELEGKKYIHPWQDENPDIAELAKKYPNLFTILLSSEYVDSSAGSGLVHCAPGCGPEDYEVGVRNNLPPYNVINEKGQFPEHIAKYAGLVAKQDDKKFIKMMEEDGFLIKKSSIEHEYPHSERSQVPVVFRTTKQWFFKVEDLKEKMLELNKETYWHPGTAKNAFASWLDNLRDNSITKQRIWGTPAPIWIHKNERGEIDEHFVIGSREELESLAGKLPENLHKPWIDSITFTSPKTGNTLERVPDVLDVWIDAGCASWASLDYPKRKDLFEEYFPADFIVEGKDQIRGWFNLLMVAGILAFDAPAFKNVSMHGFLSGVDGVKMSKSLGNIISPEEIIQKTSVDTFRYYFTGNKAGEDISFSWDQLALHHRHLTILWNTAKYFLDQLDAQEDLTIDDVLHIGPNHLTEIEQYMLSKTHTTIQHVTTLFESHKMDEVPEVVAELFLALSRNYIQAVRDKLSRTKEERAAALYTIYKSISASITLFSPICPFITEAIYQNIASRIQTKEYSYESIHEQPWPSAEKQQIRPAVEKSVELALGVISGVLAAREVAQQNVRQPLAKAVLITTHPETTKAAQELQELVKTQTNIKELDVVESFDKLVYIAKPNYKEIGLDFGTETATVAKAISEFEHPEHIYATVQQGKTFDLDGKKIKPQHVTFDISVEKPFTCAHISQGIVAVDTTLSEELLIEGFCREFTRRIQQERKNMGLVKKDRVSVALSDKKVFDMINSRKQQVQELCGITELELKETVSGITQNIKGTTFIVEIKRG